MINIVRGFGAAIAFSLLVAKPALAGDVPLYRSEPDWVEPGDFESIMSGVQTSNQLVVSIDRQVKLEDGEVWQYADIVFRGSSAEALAQIGRLQGGWHPDRGDFIVHNVQIIRDGEIIDALADGRKFEILRRESGLEKLKVDGILTAFLQLEGLQIGDMVRLTASTTIRDPALDGNIQLSDDLLVEPFSLQYGKFQIIWPKSDDIRWQVVGEGADFKISTKGAYKKLAIAVPVPKQPENAPDAPLRYAKSAFVEATSFPDWRSVSRTAARLYKVDGLITEGSELAKESDLIAARFSDPKERSAAALQLVQDKIHYLFNGLGSGNYTPQSPEETWALRYGDCKAKTLLLLALLDRLGIEAQPALVHSSLADAIPDRLPSFVTFDHIIVRATIDGQTYWLDGTRNGDRLADLADTPPFRYALPANADGADLETIPLRPIARPIEQISLSLDASAGVGFPAPFSATIVGRGAVVDQLQTYKNAVSPSEYEETLDAYIMQYSGENSTVVSREVLFDESAGTVTVSGRGLATMPWTRDRNRQSYAIDNYIKDTTAPSIRTKAEWKDIPYAMSYPGYYIRKIRISLPDDGQGFELEGSADAGGIIAGYEQQRKSAIIDGQVEVDEFWRTARWELPADEVTAERAKLFKAQTPKLQIKAPENYPDRWLETKVAIESGRLDPIIALYNADIEAHSDETRPYENLARFYTATFQYVKAAEQLELALQREQDPATYVWLAELFQTVGDKRAMDVAQKALAMDPASLGAIGIIADGYARRKETPRALAFLEEVKNNGVDDDAVATIRAEVLMLAGQYDEALAVVDELVVRKPNDPALLNLRCWTKGRANRQLDTALKDCTKAIQLAESPSSILDSRALAFFRLGQFEDAISDLDAALDLNPGLAPSLYLRGITYARIGEQAKSDADIAAARYILPEIDKDYTVFGIAR